MPPFKDPVRIVTKAGDEYRNRFDDGVLPEACVTDVVRARVRCQSGGHAHALIRRFVQQTLQVDMATAEVFPPPECSDEEEDARLAAEEAAALEAGQAAKGKSRSQKPAAMGKVAQAAEPTRFGPLEERKTLVTVETFDLANKFHDLDPTHFRHATLILKITYQNRSLFCEVEVHLEKIARIGFDPINQAYEHYNFFRRRLAGSVPEERLNALLEEKLVFLVDATGVPVLLSLLVLIFTSGGEDLTKLPSNRIELYELGIESAITKRLQTKKSTSSEAEASDLIIRRWMMLFNLDRSQMNVENDDQFQEKKREKRPTRKANIKFEEISTDHVAGQSSGQSGEANAGDRIALKSDPKEVYEIFRHGHHYLREAAKPEVQRTELNRIELSMPKKLVDTVMMLVNGNLKMLLGGRAHNTGVTMLRNVAVINQQNGRREFSSAQVAAALLLDLPNADAFSMTQCIQPISMTSVVSLLVLVLPYITLIAPLCYCRDSNVASSRQGRGTACTRSNDPNPSRSLLSLPAVPARAFSSPAWLCLPSAPLESLQAGLPLTKTLEVQTDSSPAQYQFKHLSFQEGLFAQHLLMQAIEGWEGWATDDDAASFLNNPVRELSCWPVPEPHPWLVNPSLLSCTCLDLSLAVHEQYVSDRCWPSWLAPRKAAPHMCALSPGGPTVCIPCSTETHNPSQHPLSRFPQGTLTPKGQRSPQSACLRSG